MSLDVEQLKLILSTVQGVSGDAVKVGTLYIAFLLLKEVLGYVMGAVILFAIYKVVRLLTTLSGCQGTAMTALKDIRRALGLPIRSVRYDGDLYSEDIHNTVEAVVSMQKAKQ